jgi:hypothetical protein
MLDALLDMIFKTKIYGPRKLRVSFIDTRSEYRGLGTEMYQELKVNFIL